MSEVRVPKRPPMIKQKQPERRRSPLAPIPVAALLDRRVCDGAIRTLGKLATWCNRAGITWVSQKRIASMTGQREQVISRHMQQLKKAGYVQVIRKGWKGVSADTVRIIYDPSINTQDAISIASTHEDCRPPFIVKAEQEMQSIPPAKQRELIAKMLAGAIKPVTGATPTRSYTMPADGETIATKRIRQGLKKGSQNALKSAQCKEAEQVQLKGCAISLKTRGYQVDKECEGLMQVVDQYVRVDRIGALIDEVLDRCKAEGLPPPRLASLLESVINLNADRIVDGVFDTAQNAPGSPTAHDRGAG